MSYKRGARVLSLAVLFAMLSQPSLAEPQIYTYDALGRLVAVQRSDGLTTITTQYRYDAAGNRTRVIITDQTLPPDPTSVSFSVADADVTEGGALLFTVTRSGASASTLTVAYATASGSAASPSDFVAISGTLTFQPSESMKNIVVNTVDDTSLEPDEMMLVNLSAPSGGATLARPQATGAIYDNDAGGTCLQAKQTGQTSQSGSSAQMPPPSC